MFVLDVPENGQNKFVRLLLQAFYLLLNYLILPQELSGLYRDVQKPRFLQNLKGYRTISIGEREEGLECEACVDGIRLEHVSEFKYLGGVLDESGTDEAEWLVCTFSVRGFRFDSRPGWV